MALEGALNLFEIHRRLSKGFAVGLQSFSGSQVSQRIISTSLKGKYSE